MAREIGMIFELYKNGKVTDFYVEQEAYSGVFKIAQKVCEDIFLVTGKKPLIKSYMNTENMLIIVGTIGRSTILKKLEEEKKVNYSNLREKRECYSFTLVENPLPNVAKAIVIAGSDKRGTIYGLFHISELLHVSPWVQYADVLPQRKDEIIFTEKDHFISKEPSVKYRGFFINDEWPAFGNWTFKHFNGFTAEMYDMIFEVLLRLKGNYMWPAMWTSSFSLDGPGLKNAELADEYGIVMGNSHHEPCLRHSEEWDKLRGENTEYGNEWNYYTNKEGLLNYWRDGLKRSGKYENVITIGMRGERDSSMLGPDATLKQNIDLLKDVITEQRKLIAEYVDPDVKKVPQMLALYKEVEPYFYGDENTEGLCTWEGLNGVTCMLCEDNFGNMRTLPTIQNCNREGGWGMYYHMDYHGGPISYEWVNSSYLPKIWDQMTTAYETGIRDIWIVNVGDLKFQEFPLSYFMDLAYDYDRYGQSAVNKTDDYTRGWIQREFYEIFNKEEQEMLLQVFKGYTRLNHNRKPEALNSETYHPVQFSEGKRVWTESQAICSKVEFLRESLWKKEDISEEIKASFVELVYYPSVASMNVLQMQIQAGWNHYYARLGAKIANKYGDNIKACIEKDRLLTKEFNELLGGKWSHLADSEHIGFTNWNDENCQYPICMTVEVANKPRLLVGSLGEDMYTSGGDWTGKTVSMRQFMQANVSEGILHLLNAGTGDIAYTIQCDCQGVCFSKTEGIVCDEEFIEVRIDKQLVEEATFFVKSEGGRVRVKVCSEYKDLPPVSSMTFLENDGYISIEAEHFKDKTDCNEGGYQVLTDYGKTYSGLKILPTTLDCRTCEKEISLSYHVYVEQAGNYLLNIYSAPVNPRVMNGKIEIGVKFNEEVEKILPVLTKDYVAGESSCGEWSQKALNQIQITSEQFLLKKGENVLKLIAKDPGLVLEKLVLVRENVKMPYSYLGPVETFYTK